MNSNPASPPAQQKCPNCGTTAPLDMALCPRCGMQLNAPSKAIYGCAVLLFQGFLALLALVFGAYGVNIMFLVVNGPPNGRELPLLLGVLLFALAGICGRAIVHITKARK